MPNTASLLAVRGHVICRVWKTLESTGSGMLWCYGSLMVFQLALVISFNHCVLFHSNRLFFFLHTFKFSFDEQICIAVAALAIAGVFFTRFKVSCISFFSLKWLNVCIRLRLASIKRGGVSCIQLFTASSYGDVPARSGKHPTQTPLYYFSGKVVPCR